MNVNPDSDRQTVRPVPQRATFHLNQYTPKIADFGLAKELGGDARMTHANAVMGTPSYMAPEQATGRIGEISPLSDVHALGAILYELLTGLPPYREESVLETLRLVRETQPVAPRVTPEAAPRSGDDLLEVLGERPATALLVRRQPCG